MWLPRHSMRHCRAIGPRSIPSACHERRMRCALRPAGLPRRHGSDRQTRASPRFARSLPKHRTASCTTCARSRAWVGDTCHLQGGQLPHDVHGATHYRALATLRVIGQQRYEPSGHRCGPASATHSILRADRAGAAHCLFAKRGDVTQLHARHDEKHAQRRVTNRSDRCRPQVAPRRPRP